MDVAGIASSERTKDAEDFPGGMEWHMPKLVQSVSLHPYTSEFFARNRAFCSEGSPLVSLLAFILIALMCSMGFPGKSAYVGKGHYR